MESSNDSYIDAFLYEIDRAVETGNIDYICNAIKLYKSNIDKQYIEMAQNMLEYLIEEKIESITLKP